MDLSLRSHCTLLRIHQSATEVSSTQQLQKSLHPLAYKRSVFDMLLHAAHYFSQTAYQEDKVLVCRDLNALVPATNDDIDRSVRRSLFAIFDGRKYMNNAVITLLLACAFQLLLLSSAALRPY
jgi:hypothetical protein